MGGGGGGGGSGSGGVTAPAASFFCSLEPQARRALDFLNRSRSGGLAFNDVARPNCTYGFTVSIACSCLLRSNPRPQPNPAC